MSPSSSSSTDVFHSGFRLSQTEALALESQIAVDPDLVHARIQLVGYYFQKAASSFSSKDKNIGALHVLWFVQKQPEMSFLKFPIYSLTTNTTSDESIKQQWELLTTTNCSSAILENAAQYFKTREPHKSITLIEQAVKLDPANIQLLEVLSDLYEQMVDKDQAQDIVVSKAIAAFEAYISKEENVHRKIVVIARLAEFARKSHNLTMAKQSVALGLELSQTVLESKIAIDAVHTLQTTRGLIFLDEGNVPGAIKALEDSQPLVKTPVLSSFGPQFGLANELLKRGERKAVCSYLSSCLKVWKNGQTSILLWLLEINLGRKPVLRT